MLIQLTCGKSVVLGECVVLGNVWVEINKSRKILDAVSQASDREVLDRKGGQVPHLTFS